jgi:hypothetical protein
MVRLSPIQRVHERDEKTSPCLGRGGGARLPQPSLIPGSDFEEMRKEHEDTKCTKALASDCYT